jgi:hypothetical protein
MIMTMKEKVSGMGYTGFLSMDALAKPGYSPDLVAERARESWELLIVATKWTGYAYVHHPMRDPAVIRDFLLFHKGGLGTPGRNRDLGVYHGNEHLTVNQILAVDEQEDEDSGKKSDDGKTAPIDIPGRKEAAAAKNDPYKASLIVPGSPPATCYMPRLAPGAIATPSPPAHGHLNNTASFGSASPIDNAARQEGASPVSPADSGPSRPPISRGNSDLIFPFELGEGGLGSRDAAFKAAAEYAARLGDRNARLLACTEPLAPPCYYGPQEGASMFVRYPPPGTEPLPYHMTRQGRREAYGRMARAREERERERAEAAANAADADDEASEVDPVRGPKTRGKIRRGADRSEDGSHDKSTF